MRRPARSPLIPAGPGCRCHGPGGIRLSLPFVRAVTQPRPCPGEPRWPAGLLVWAIHRPILNFAAVESLHGEAEAAALFVLERIGLAKGRSCGRARLSRLPPRPHGRGHLSMGQPHSQHPSLPSTSAGLGPAASSSPATLPGGCDWTPGPQRCPASAAVSRGRFLQSPQPVVQHGQREPGPGLTGSRERGRREQWGSHTLPLLLGGSPCLGTSFSMQSPV